MKKYLWNESKDTGYLIPNNAYLSLPPQYYFKSLIYFTKGDLAITYKANGNFQEVISQRLALMLAWFIKCRFVNIIHACTRCFVIWKFKETVFFLSFCIKIVMWHILLIKPSIVLDVMYCTSNRTLYLPWKHLCSLESSYIKIKY